MKDPSRMPGLWKLGLLFVAVVIALAAVSLPGLRGDWVYDDIALLDNPALDDWSDIPASFQRNSADFHGRGSSDAHAGAVSYRPITIAVLTASHVIGQGSPLAHHLVGLLLHAFVICALVGLLRRNGGASNTLGAMAIVVCAFHPATAEAWVWISGVNDLTGATVLAATAWLLLPNPSQIETRVARVFAIGTGACVLGVLSKEPALPAVAAVVLASTLPGRSPASEWWTAVRTNAPAVVTSFAAGFLALGTYALAKSWTLDGGATHGIAGITSPATLLQRFPLLASIAVERLLTPMPIPMRLVAWDFEVGWTITRAVCAGGLLVGALALAALGYLRALVLLAGALCTLLPTTYVVDHDWMGFDRYLYMPLVLLAVAVVSRPRPPSSGTRREVIALVALSAVLGAALHLQSRTLASQLAWTTAIAQYQPESGAGTLRVTEFHLVHGNPHLAAETLATLPAPDRLPAAGIRSGASLWIRLGQPGRGSDLLELGHAAHPDDVGIRLALMDARRFRGDWPGLLQITEPLLSNRRLCGPATEMIRQWQRAGIELPPQVAAELQRLQSDSPCRRTETATD